jgi:pilus assembly protein Flp/PilA
VIDVIRYWHDQCEPYLRARFQRRSELGATLVEYALLVALIAVVAIAAITLLGSNASKKLGSVGSSLQ